MREAMPADAEEIEQAIEEGIAIHSGRTFERITGTAAVSGIDFMEVARFSFDENRRAIIEKKEGSEQHIEADTVIFAVGQRPDISSDTGLALGRGNCIMAKEQSTVTGIPGIFAAGDALYGTKSVVMAVESGREAAGEIDRRFGGDGDISEILAPMEQARMYIGTYPGFGYLKRAGIEIIKAENRITDFNLIDHGIRPEDICGEADRCLQCDLRLRISPPRLWADYAGKKEA
jgi:NADPH-dependent glutamate synthase beta subunit-like oxidoreductase